MFYYKRKSINYLGEESYNYHSSEKPQDNYIQVSKEEFEKYDFLNSFQNKISYYEDQLKQTDYIALKIAEGASTKEEYSSELEQRQYYRDQINALEAQAQQYLQEDNTIITNE